MSSNLSYFFQRKDEKFLYYYKDGNWGFKDIIKYKSTLLLVYSSMWLNIQVEKHEHFLVVFDFSQDRLAIFL